MSGLGSTVEPAGEPGSIVSAAQTPLLPETLPSNDATIAQTTSINTLEQVAYKNYIRQGTYTWASNMPAGTVITAIKIHPDKCNYVVRYINKLFNTFTGGMKGRMRALATAFYGGDLRMGRLPPNLTEQQIFQMPLEVLTAHPNESFDPKNTGWIHFSLSDQRPIAYHYNGAADDDANSFGGWFVIFVAGRLVTQNPDFTQIDLVLEFAGGFQWDQLAPEIPSGSNDQNDPLHDSSKFPLHLHPTLDNADVGHWNAIVVQPNTVTSIPAGAIGHSAIGLPLAVGKVPGLTTTDQAGLTAQQNMAVSSLPYYTTPEDASTGIMPIVSTAIRLPFNMERGINMTCYGNYSALDHEYYRVIAADYDSSGSTSQINGSRSAPPDTWTHGKLLYPGQVTVLPSESLTPPNPALIGSTTHPISIVSPTAAGESIVTFCNLAHRSISSQTELIANELGRYKQNLALSNTSKLYTLRNEAGTPLAVWRVNPNGVFSTKATTTPIVYPAKGLTLDYLQDLPVNEPLPAPTFSSRQLEADIRMITRRAATRALTTSEMIGELSDLIRSY